MDEKSISNTFKIFFQHERDLCFLKTNESFECPTVWWYLTCLKLENNISRTVSVECPFYILQTSVTCVNRTWNITAEKLFNNCKGKDFVFLSYLRNYLFKSLCPILLFVFMTSTFKLYKFTEISEEFHWKIIIWTFIFKSISTITEATMALLNSGYVIYQLCMIMVIFEMYGEYFTICSVFVQCFYLYSIVTYVHSQFRIIKSALSHIMFMCPAILIVLGLILDVTFSKGRTFRCLDEPMSSPIQFLYVCISLSCLITIIYMYTKIKHSISSINVTDNQSTVYRVEYDIIGMFFNIWPTFLISKYVNMLISIGTQIAKNFNYQNQGLIGFHPK